MTAEEVLSSACQLVTTNAPLRAQDRIHVEGLLSNIEKEASHLQAKIKHYQGQILVVQQRLQELECKRAYFKPVLSPIRSIPPEILAEIFSYTLDYYPSTPQRMLTRLCLVCKGWRDAAHMFPGFWRHVNFNPSNPSLTFAGVSSWISRAKKLPTTLCVYSAECRKKAVQGELVFRVRSVCAGATCSFSNPVLSRLLKEGPLLHSVEISYPTPECLATLASSIMPDKAHTTQASSWDSIKSVKVWAGWHDGWKTLPPSTFHFLPESMTSLDLALGPWRTGGRGRMSFNIPAYKLTNLTFLRLISDWPGNTHLRLLRECSQLETLFLDLSGGKFSDWEHVGDGHGLEAVLPKLQVLHLNGVDIQSISRLPMIKAPTLRKLSVMLGRSDWYVGDPLGSCHANIMSTANGTYFTAFLRGDPSVPSTLEYLSIQNGIFEVDVLVDALKDLTSLNHLALDNVMFDEGTFREIDSRGLLPKLETMELLRLHDGSRPIGREEFAQKRGVTMTVSQCRSKVCGCKE